MPAGPTRLILAISLALAAASAVLTTGLSRAQPAEEAQPTLRETLIAAVDEYLRFGFPDRARFLEDLGQGLAWAERIASAPDDLSALSELNLVLDQLLGPTAIARVFPRLPAQLPRGRLGFFLASRPGEPTTGGVSVAWVFPGSPAERMGLRAGDLITAIDGRPTAALPANALLVSLVAREPGAMIEVAFRRPADPALGQVVWRGAVADPEAYATPVNTVTAERVVPRVGVVSVVRVVDGGGMNWGQLADTPGHGLVLDLSACVGSISPSAVFHAISGLGAPLGTALVFGPDGPAGVVAEDSPRRPLAVLVSELTGPGCTMVAAALRLASGAITVGEPSPWKVYGYSLRELARADLVIDAPFWLVMIGARQLTSLVVDLPGGKDPLRTALEALAERAR